MTLLSSCSQGPRIEQVQGPTMGTAYQVKYVSDGRVNSVVVADAVREALAAVDLRMSTYKPSSELMQLNAAPLGEHRLSPELAAVLGRSLELAELSEGALDVTVGPLVNLWGFGPDLRPERMPSETELASAFARTGFRALKLDGERVFKEQERFIDLSSIAKGYAVDQVAAALEGLGIRDYLVEVGGELRVGGRKPDLSDWLIGIEEPDSIERTARLAIRAPGLGIATSGDYRNYFEHDGVRFSHTIDPATGRPITNRLASVTVVAPDCMSADGWATALMVLGEQKGLALAQAQGLAAYFIFHGEQGFESAYSEAFAAYLIEQDAR